MSSRIFINFPVSDIERSARFYTALGFKKNEEFSVDTTYAMEWDEHLWVMLITPENYQLFIPHHTIADTQTTNSTILSITLPDKEAVREFAKQAEENGGRSYTLDLGMSEEEMFSIEVIDPDGNILEPTWMNL